MAVGLDEAWRQARTVFNLRSLALSGKQLNQARRQARPFVRLVSREFRRSLGMQLLSEKESASREQLQLEGWSAPLLLSYPKAVNDGKRTTRARYDGFGVPPPTGKWELSLRFSLGAGERGERAWGLIEWGLMSWGSKRRITSETMSVLREIHSRVEDLDLESWQGCIRPLGTFAWVGKTAEFSEFGKDIANSVRTVAADLARLLDAVVPYQER